MKGTLNKNKTKRKETTTTKANNKNNKNNNNKNNNNKSLLVFWSEVDSQECLVQNLPVLSTSTLEEKFKRSNKSILEISTTVQLVIVVLATLSVT